MSKRVIVARQEENDRRTRQDTVTVAGILEEESGEEQDKEDDEDDADERNIWQVTDVTEEDLETTEGKEVDLLATLLELVGWVVNNKERQKELSWLLFHKVSWTFVFFLWTLLNLETLRYMYKYHRSKEVHRLVGCLFQPTYQPSVSWQHLFSRWGCCFPTHPRMGKVSQFLENSKSFEVGSVPSKSRIIELNFEW
jgi:hypothetical protein